MKTRAKKALFLALILSTAFLTGCWNYRSLSDIDIVAGMAIDLDESGNGFMVTLEIVDLTRSNKDKGIKPVLVESQGTTIFEAIRNANKRIESKPYFGATELVVISQNVIQKNGLLPILDWLMRDNEPRDILLLAISQMPTAAEILKAQGVDQTVKSFEIRKIINNNTSVLSTSVYVELYKIFGTLMSKGKQLTLPALKVNLNDNTPIIELDGIAVFFEDRLAGFLSPEETRYFLMAAGLMKGGILAVHSTKGYEFDASLEIKNVRTKTKWEEEDHTCTIKLTMDAYLGEFNSSTDHPDKMDYVLVRGISEKIIQENIEYVLHKLQTQYQSDILRG